MTNEYTLFMVMLGAKPAGRVTEQHDIFFGIAKSLRELIPEMKAFWPETKGQIHIDAWRKISYVDGYAVDIVPKTTPIANQEALFFVNLGGYKENEFEEYHYKIVTVAPNKATAIKKAKQTTFYKHCGFEGATSHIDDTYGIDVDDIYQIADLLAPHYKERFQIKLSKTTSTSSDTLEIGYVKLDKLLKNG